MKLTWGRVQISNSVVFSPKNLSILIENFYEILVKLGLDTSIKYKLNETVFAKDDRIYILDENAKLHIIILKDQTLS